jgi:hypothetical protein
MGPVAFGLLILVSFVAPVPIIAWLDRPRPKKGA